MAAKTGSSSGCEALAIAVLCDAVSMLDHLHTKGYVHRDLKLNNFMIHDEVLFLLDFGYAAPCHSTGRLANVYGGTLEYTAPQQLQYDWDAQILPSQDW